jgi:DNA-binding Lrp family transcriptional regulator
MKAFKEYLEEIIDPEDVKMSGFTIKDDLDPVIWEKNKLKEYISKHLYKIAKNFFQNLGLEWSLVKDVTLTGSLANYNWSRYSDVDLHILVDYSQVDENEKLVTDLFRSVSSMWNKTHNIRIKGHDVELYVQDSREQHHSTGVYSIKYDRWNKTPSRYNPQIDEANVKKKAAKFMNHIDDIYDDFAEKKYKFAHDEANKLREKLRKFRQGGLEKGGEHSVENLVYKVLRRNDYLHKLSSLKIMSYDKMMSVNGIGSEIVKINI